MRKHFLSINLILAIPAVALANAGSPVVWLGLFHLLFANAVIGLCENFYLERRGFPNRTWMVILANYISMAIGYFLIPPLVIHTKYGRDPDRLDISLVLAIAFLLTLVIEYPIFRLALKRREQRNHFFKVFLKANLWTNIVMWLLYMLLAG